MVKKFLSIMIIFCVFFLSIPSPSVHAFTPDDYLGNLSWDKMTDTEKWLLCFNFTVSQCKAVLTADAKSYIENMDAIREFKESKSPDDIATVKDNNITISKEYVSLIKSAIDQYAKEHEPYTMYRTVPLTSIPYTAFNNQSNVYQSLKNLIADSSSGVVGVSFSWATGAFTFTDIGSHFKDVGLVKYYYDGYGYKAEVKAYEISTWKHANYPRYRLTLSDEDAVIKDKEDFIARATETFTSYNEYLRFICLHDNVSIQSIERNVLGTGNQVANVLVSSDSRRIRVYNTYADFQDYSLNKRSVYFLPGYYDYEPSEITGSIEDLQKSVDDLSKALDQLLDQITKDMDESEIEELLKQILEELRNGGGSGGGSGGSGGDVNVDIDLSTTNGLLSKILAKVTQIFDKISETATGTIDTVNTKLQETLDEILSTLRTISGDVNDIKGQLETMSEQEFNEKSDSFLGEVMDAFSEVSEVVKTKFPFSIPNDLRIFLSKIAPVAPETEEQQIESYSFDSSSGISLYSGEHGGGGTSDGETNPPGGGGASRPGSGFVDVEHGGGGGTREPVEMREAPVFCLPIVIERYGIEEYIIIDMSPFDPLSRFSRSFFTIIFMVCLFNLTFKVIGMWGDLIG